MSISYDGASLVPDLSNSLRMAFGIAQKREEEEKARAAEAEFTGILDQIFPGQVAVPAGGEVAAGGGAVEAGPLATVPTIDGKPVVTSQVSTLHNPAVLKSLARLGRIDPNGAKFLIGTLQTMDEAAARDAAKQAGRAQSVFQQLSLMDDPVERNRLLATSIRDLEAEGLPTDKLRELIGQSPDQQRVSILSRLIATTDAKQVFEQHQEALKTGSQVGLQNAQRLKAEQDVEFGVADEQREVNADARAERTTDSALKTDVLQRQKLQKEINKTDKETKRGDETAVSGMRKEFTALAKPFIEVRDAYQRVQTSAAQQTAAGDLALIFNFMKILDPGSVVREGEFATAQKAAGVPDQIRNLYNRVRDGERLNPAQRKDFTTTAGNLYLKQKQSFERTADEFRRIAQNRGYAPEDIIVNLGLPAGETAPAGAPKAEAVPGLDQALARAQAQKKRAVGRFIVEEVQ